MDFDGFSLKIHEKSWVFMISQGSLGNLGVNLIHPPKMCPRLRRTFVVFLVPWHSVCIHAQVPRGSVESGPRLLGDLPRLAPLHAKKRKHLFKNILHENENQKRNGILSPGYLIHGSLTHGGPCAVLAES